MNDKCDELALAHEKNALISLSSKSKFVHIKKGNWMVAFALVVQRSHHTKLLLVVTDCLILCYPNA